MQYLPLFWVEVKSDYLDWWLFVIDSLRTKRCWDCPDHAGPVCVYFWNLLCLLVMWDLVNEIWNLETRVCVLAQTQPATLHMSLWLSELYFPACEVGIRWCCLFYRLLKITVLCKYRYYCLYNCTRCLTLWRTLLPCEMEKIVIVIWGFSELIHKTTDRIWWKLCAWLLCDKGPFGSISGENRKIKII